MIIFLMLVATAPTVYGIETNGTGFAPGFIVGGVATAPTVYGIETRRMGILLLHNSIQLQQHLPFTVLKLYKNHPTQSLRFCSVATAPTVYGIETW